MKAIIIHILFFTSLLLQAQNPELAKKYFEDADFDKAIVEYKALVDKFPYKDEYIINLLRAYQAEKRYKEAEDMMRKLKTKNKPQFLVYLGYNHQLQKDSVQAQKYYKKAIRLAEKRSYYTYQVGAAFQKFYLLDEALQVYKNAMKEGKNQNFYIRIAQIYAEKNDKEQMIEN